MRRLAVLVGAVVFFDTMFYAALAPLLPRYAHDLGLGKSGAGVLAGSYAVGVLAAGIPAGLAASWLGVKRTLLAGLAGMIVTTTLFGFAHSVWLLDAARFLQGCASSLAWTAGLAWLVADAPSDARGRLIGSAMGAAIFGSLFGPVVGGIAAVTNTAATFGAVACFGFAVAAWAWTTPSRHEAQRQPLSMLVRAVRNRRVLASVWFVALPAVSFGTVNVLGPLRLDALGLGAAAIGAIWLTIAAVEGVMSPLVGHVSDRRGRLPPLGGGLAAATVLFCALPLLEERWWLLAPGVVACGGALGAFWAPAMSMLSDEAEATGLDYAFGFTLVGLAWAPAQLAGAAGGGALADAASDSAPYLVLAGLCLLTFAVLWTTRPSRSSTTRSAARSSAS